MLDVVTDVHTFHSRIQDFEWLIHNATDSFVFRQ